MLACRGKIQKMKKFPPEPKSFVGGVAVLAAAILAVSGCGGGETAVTAEVTVTQTQAGTSTVEKEAYKQSINDLTARANQINSDCRGLIDKLNAGQAKKEDLVNTAEQDRLAYQDMVARLTAMKVPPEFQQAHLMLISGFGKWAATFEAYRDGYRNSDNAALARAGDLDNQAIIEVNQSVNLISQVQ